MPCRLSIGGQRVHDCRRTLNRHGDSEVHRNESFIDTYLKVLGVNRYCGDHSGSQQPELRERWKSAIEVARGEAFSNPVRSVHHHTDQLGTSFENHDVHSGYVMTRNTSLHTRSSPMMTCAPNMDAAAFWPEAMESSPWIILARKSQVGFTTRNPTVPFVGRKS